MQTADQPLREFVIAETFQFGGRENGSGEYTEPRNLNPVQDGINLSIRTKNDKCVIRWNDIDEYFLLKDDSEENVNLNADKRYSERINLWC